MDVVGSGLVVDERLKGWWMWKEVVSWLIEGGAAGG